MKPALRILPLLTLWLLVPWWFSGSASGMPGFWGIPMWAWYAIGMTLLYAILVAWMLGRFWDREAEISELEAVHQHDENAKDEDATT